MSEYLKFISFSELDSWSVKYLIESSFSYNEKYSLIKIGSFLTRNKKIVNILDDEKYKRVTIKINNGGVFLRDIEQGINIGTKKQFIISEGQFLVSKIDARNGAFGVIPSNLGNAIITGNFWTFDVDYSLINPHFLSLITTTKEFILFCSNASNGTTNRHYLQEQAFLNVKIPLPSLQEQNRLLEKYTRKIALAEKQEKEAKEIEGSLELFFNQEIGLELLEEDTQKKTILKTFNYEDLDTWGVDKLYIQDGIKYTKNYPIKPINTICQVSSGGTPSRSRKEYYTGSIPWIKTGEVINEIIYDTKEKITEEAIQNSSAKLYKKGSLIIAMYGQGLTRGRTAKLGIDASTNQACAVLYNIDNELILIDYLWFYMMNEYHRLREMASGNSQPNLNAQMIKGYKVVIPPFDIQEKIIEEISSRKEKIKQLRSEALKNREDAIREFEEEIFTS
jgi:restriction endonuclease S subunit